jgi:hypothetical protein
LGFRGFVLRLPLEPLVSSSTADAASFSIASIFSCNLRAYSRGVINFSFSFLPFGFVAFFRLEDAAPELLALDGPATGGADVVGVVTLLLSMSPPGVATVWIAANESGGSGGEVITSLERCPLSIGESPLTLSGFFRTESRTFTLAWRDIFVNEVCAGRCSSAMIEAGL